MSETQLIEQSQLIVVGELLGEAELKGLSGHEDLQIGVLRVDEVLKGPAQSPLVFIALPLRKGPESSADIHYRSGTRGLWYLRARRAGETVYLADHPQRFVAEKAAIDRLSTLRQQLNRQR